MATNPHETLPKGGNKPLMGFGQVRHTRLRPVRHGFFYATYFLMLPLRTMAKHGSGDLPRNRAGLVSFHDRDHGAGGSDALAWVDNLLRSEGIQDALGEVWLQCFPRVAGYTFKPVSFWYCHHHNGALRAVVAEVNNTFGERHFYLLDQARFGTECTAAKMFYVSPFCAVTGDYRFRFMRQTKIGSDRMVARVDHHSPDATGRLWPLLQTSVSGALEPLDRRSLRRAFWAYPLMTWGVVARIHWQALRLWLKRVPFFSHSVAAVTPERPVAQATTPPVI